MIRNRVFSPPKCRKWTLWITQKLVHKKCTFIIRQVYTRHWMWYSSITTLAIWDYNEKEVDFANHYTSRSKIFDLIRPDDEWAEIAFSGRQNAKNEHCETQKKLVHKLNFLHKTCLYMILNVVFLFYYSSNLSSQWDRGGLCRYF